MDLQSMWVAYSNDDANNIPVDANNIPVAERNQYTFLSHDPHVLAQLEEEYPEIYHLFPFYLGWKSGITKDFAYFLL